MNQRILEFEKQFYKSKLPDIRPGDTVRVHQRIQEGEKTRIHQFEGVVIAQKHGKGMGGSFTVRKIGVGGVGVEQTFFWHAPSLFKVERIKKGDVRRAKLYYLHRLTARAAKKLAGVRVGEVWEEAASNAVSDKETKEGTSDVPTAKAKIEEGQKESDEKTDQTPRQAGGAAGSGTPPGEGVPAAGDQS